MAVSSPSADLFPNPDIYGYPAPNLATIINTSNPIPRADPVPPDPRGNYMSLHGVLPGIGPNCKEIGREGL